MRNIFRVKKLTVKSDFKYFKNQNRFVTSLTPGKKVKMTPKLRNDQNGLEFSFKTSKMLLERLTRQENQILIVIDISYPQKWSK